MSESASRAWLIGLGTAVVTLVVQGALMLRVQPVDLGLWTKALTFSGGDLLPAFSNMLSFYPGITIILPTRALILGGVDPSLALVGVVALYTALAIAALVALVYQRRPQSWAWLGVAALFVFSTFSVHATPISVVVTPLLALISLLLLGVCERGVPLSGYQAAALRVLVGLALATRMDISLLFALCAAIAVWVWSKDLRGIAVAAGTALATLFVVDPYLWSGPVAYVQLLYKTIHWVTRDLAAQPPPQEFLMYVPFGLLGAVLVLLVAFVSRGSLSFPRRFLILPVIFSLVASGALFASPFHPIWYFFPMAAIWMVLLALTLYSLEGVGKLQKVALRTSLLAAPAALYFVAYF